MCVLLFMPSIDRLNPHTNTYKRYARYFGGIKLGAGGLVRAYGGVTRNCLRAAETVTRVPRAMVRVKAPLALAGAVFQVSVGCVIDQSI